MTTDKAIRLIAKFDRPRAGYIRRYDVNLNALQDVRKKFTPEMWRLLKLELKELWYEGEGDESDPGVEFILGLKAKPLCIAQAKVIIETKGE